MHIRVKVTLDMMCYVAYLNRPQFINGCNHVDSIETEPFNMLEVFRWLLIGRIMGRWDEQGAEKLIVCHKDGSEQFAEGWSMVWMWCKNLSFRVHKPVVTRSDKDAPGTLGYSCCTPCSSSVSCLSGSCKMGFLCHKPSERRDD
jgi:hypothetical protein